VFDSLLYDDGSGSASVTVAVWAAREPLAVRYLAAAFSETTHSRERRVKLWRILHVHHLCQRGFASGADGTGKHKSLSEVSLEG